MTLAEALDSGALDLSRLRLPESLATFGNPPDFDRASARVLIVRLSGSRDVERSTPHLFLFGECRRSLPDAYLDFAFLPGPRDRALLSRHGVPWFFGVASARPVGDFDLVLVSNSYSLELFNLPYLFSSAGLPLRAKARRNAGVDAPLFVIGGSNASALAPIVDDEGDSFADAIFFGEAEGGEAEGRDREAVIPRLLSALLPDGTADATTRLDNARSIEGLFVSPATVTRGERVRVRSAGAVPAAPAPRPILNDDEASTSRIQISHGCPSFCSFCFEGWDRRPWREVPAREVLSRALAERIGRGAEAVEPYSFNFNAHSEFPALALGLNKIFPRVDFMSQRTDILAEDPSLAAFETAGGKRSFTVGIEGISDRLRAFYRKGLSGRQVERALESLLREKPKELKLFYILAGIETEPDLGEFAAFAVRLRELRESLSRHTRVVCSAGRLVRLPFTPLFPPVFPPDDAAFRRIASRCETVAKEAGFEWRLAQRPDEFAADQALAAGAGRFMDGLAACADAGFVYDGSLSRGAWELLATWADGVPRALPFLDGVVSAETLARFRADAEAFSDGGSCFGSSCLGCGACSQDERDALETHALSKAGATERKALAELVSLKARAEKRRFVVALPETLYGAVPAFISSWILRRCFAAVRGSERAILGAREALFSVGGFFADALPAFSGATVVEFACVDPIASVRAITAAFPEAREVERDYLPARVRAGGRFPTGPSGLDALRDLVAAERWKATERRTERGRSWEFAAEARHRGFSRLDASYADGTLGLRLDAGRHAPIAALVGALGFADRPLAYRLSVESLLD